MMTSNVSGKPAGSPQSPAKSPKKSFPLRNIKYYFTEVFKSLIRNKLMSLTSIVTVAACMIIVISAYAIAANINYILSYLENSVGITVMIDETLSAEDIGIMREDILAIGNISQAEFISAEQALYTLAASLGDETGNFIMSLAPYNPLRHSFSLSLYDARMQSESIAQISAVNGVAAINDASALTNGLVSINNFISVVSILIILVLGVLSVVIITNTIKLTVNNRRNEIIIMKYVGATEWFIKWPFVIEGVLIGIFGALVPLSIAWAGYDNVVDSIASIPVIGEPLPFMSASDIFPWFSPIVIILGAGIGIIGSISSMRKYLSV